MLAAYAPAIFFDGVIQKTSLGLFLTSVLLLLVVRFAAAPRARCAAASGVVLALLALTRENALIFAFVLPAWFGGALRRHPGSARLSWALAFTLGLATMCIGIGQGIATVFERV